MGNKSTVCHNDKHRGAIAVLVLCRANSLMAQRNVSARGQADAIAGCC